MNELSWFLYLAEILPRIGSFTGIMGLLLFGVAFILPPKGVKLFSRDHEALFTGLDRLVVPFCAWLLLLLLAFLTPSKETIYLIAGSEAGEAVVTSPEGQEILNDIKQIIRGQLNSLKGE